MQALLASEHIVDLIIVVMAVELAALGFYRWRAGRGMGLGDATLMLLPGLALLLALRAAIAGLPWPHLALWLTLALFAHLADVWRRQKRS